MGQGSDLIRVRLCGTFGIEASGHAIEPSRLPGRQGRLLLAYLLCADDRLVTRDEVADLLWPGAVPSSWSASVSALVSKLRRLLDELGLDAKTVLTSNAGGYRLALPEDVWVDWLAAQQGSACAEQALRDGDAPRAIEVATAAIAIVDPGFFAEPSPWVDEQRVLAREVCVQAELALAEAHLLAGSTTRAVEAARSALTREPTREAAFRVLMTALAATGERAEALRTWERCRATLVEELGVDPSSETEAVYLSILEGTARPTDALVATATSLPSGVVTFLFTDIVDSSMLWERDPAGMDRALRRHDAVIADIVARHGGTLLKSKLEGDATVSVFPRATEAALAAIDVRAGVAAEAGPAGVALAVRVALHTGEALERDGDYYGPALNRTARLRALADGDQILLSQASAELVRDHLPDEIVLVERGRHDLRGLSRGEYVYELAPPAVVNDADNPVASTGTRSLPVLATRCIGRSQEIEEIVQSLDGASVVTLTGVGGVGKTRLALEVAARLAPSLRDGVAFAELGGVITPGGVTDAVATAVGFMGGTAVASGLHDHLRNKELLLVIDNCEHLLTPVATLVAEMLRDAPGVRVLATSREGLGVSGEHVRVVPSLTLPDRDDPPATALEAAAVRLFIERAREADITVELADDDIAAVAEICRRLDGIPLAIELAAARTVALTPAEIAGHLDRRFRLLTGGRRAAVSRHQTLHNAIEWSHQLLDPEERALFDRLAVFAGGFDLASAHGVAAADGADDLSILDVLARLVAKSLIVAERRDGTTRYRMLETVREFAWERLDLDGASQCTARRHAEYFAVFAREAAAGLRSPEEARWRKRIARELDNLRAAVSWAIAADDVDLALGPVAELGALGELVGPHGTLAEDAARLDLGHPLAPIALAAASWTAAVAGDGDHARQLAEEAEALVASLERTPEGLWARCRVANATMTARTGHFDLADWQGFTAQFLVDARELGDPWSLNEALILVIGLASDADEGIRAGEEALALARQIGAPSRTAYAAIFLAGRVMERDEKRAFELLALANESAATSGNGWAEVVINFGLVSLYRTAGDWRNATAICIEAIERSATLPAGGFGSFFVSYLAEALAELGDDDGALILAAWGELRGMTPHLKDATSTGTEFIELRARTPASQMEHFRQLAAPLDERAIAQMAHDRLADLAENDQPSPTPPDQPERSERTRPSA